MIQTYTRRPEHQTIKALKFNGENAYEFMGLVGIIAVKDAYGNTLLQVHTLDGIVIALRGDYIAWDSHGKPYPVAKEEFERIYEVTP